MSIYVNFDHLIDYLRKVRKNRIVNISPYMDNALLNVQQMSANVRIRCAQPYIV